MVKQLRISELRANLLYCHTLYENLQSENDLRIRLENQLCHLLVVREALAVAGPHRWLISSFDLAMVDAVVATGAGIATAWLVVAVPAGTVPLLTERGHRALHPWVGSLDRSTVDECHAAGIAVNTWTCDDPDRMRELIGWGVDGICTNVPDIALAVRDAS